MSDTASSSRPADPSPVPGDATDARRKGQPFSSGSHPPVRDDQATIISREAPIATPSASDSAHRALQGSPLPGDRLGEFELVQYVGGGGMGRVFRAMDTRLGRTVALKILLPEQTADEETLLRFQNEAQSVARLDHENIARVYQVGEDQGLHYIVFEFIEGVNIRALVEQKGPLSLAQAVSYALQITDALEHATERAVVHRDVKPSNVLITPQGRVKLIDMGLARLRNKGSSAADLTASGVTLGTFDYIAPEQARDPRNADVRSDLYSLGCTFFYMLAGRPPFPEGTVLQKLLQHQGDEPPDVRMFRPELPEEVARILGKMLAKDPGHRYQSPSELVDDLTLLAYQLGLRPAGSSGKVLVAPQGPKVTFFQRHLPWMAPVAALVCIVVVLDFLWSSPPQREEGPAAPWEAQNRVEKPAAIPKANSEDGSPPVAQREVPQPPPGGPGGKSPGVVAIEPAAAAISVDGGVAPPEGESGTTTSAAGPPEPEPAPTGDPRWPTWRDQRSKSLTEHLASQAIGSEPVGAGISAAESESYGIGAIPREEAVSGSLGGAVGATAGPDDDGAFDRVAPKRSGLLVIGDSADGETQFSSLSAACSAAANNDVIELRYDGRHEERPITLANRKLTIRAGKGYQPVVVFRPNERETDPVEYPRSMFTLTAGRLALVGLALELHVPLDVPADRWAMFESRGGQTVRLQQCSLSIHNASDALTADHDEVAFFYAESAPGADTAIADEAVAAMPFATVDLVDCIVRGEAVLLRASQLQPIQLIFENGLLATTEWALLADGGKRVPWPGDLLQVDLRHVTAMLGSGFCRFTDTQSAPHRLDAQICCANSIVMAAQGAPFIEQIGVANLDDFRRQISYSGDRNFYEAFDSFWVIRNLDQDDLTEPYSFEAWKRYWSPEGENLPESNQVVWKNLPKADRPLHTHTPADYMLSDRASAPQNPALGAASDGSNAGFQADRLPSLPPPIAEEAGRAAR